MNNENYYKIYIIESPSEMDFIHSRTEGRSLSEILKLQNIDYEYFICISEESIIKTIGLIIEDIQRLQEDYTFVWPTIHISSHGTENSIVLSNGDLIEWNEFGKHLESINHIAFDELDFSPIQLVMSCCYGYLVSNSDISSDKKRFNVVIGCEEPIRWDAAIVAFSSFYHNIIVKNQHVESALRCMNSSINEKEHFKLYRCKRLLNIMEEKE